MGGGATLAITRPIAPGPIIEAITEHWLNPPPSRDSRRFAWGGSPPSTARADHTPNSPIQTPPLRDQPAAPSLQP